MSFIKFKSSVSIMKPNLYIEKNQQCPFCDRDSLRAEGRIIKETSNFVIIRNKYPIMEGTYSTILIEHNSCKEHIGSYDIEYLTEFLKFALEYYDYLLKSSKFTSLTFFKNSGLFACGSINHPHCQIIGYKNKSYKENLHDTDFIGIPIISNQTIDWNISTKPRSEFYEINLILKENKRIDILALYLQKSVNFILNILNSKYQSYNLAFYIEEKNIKLKVIPRGPTSVLLLGYGIHQTPDDLEEKAELLKKY
jgi:diadenosine tetraphosphate (Ap4A) HIT family hydrolase